ncbi:MAG: DUF4139 domain-containing protein [Crocinitomicaceae bacterium]
MKTIILLVFTMLTATSFATDSLQTTVSKATVFLSGAQVFRESKSFSVKKGVNEVVITDVSPYLNQNQIQATAKGNFLILDIQYQTEYIPPTGVIPAVIPQKIQKEIDWLNDTILFIGFEKERISEKLKNLNEEKRMVTQSQLIKSGGISDTLPEFKEIVEFYRVKLDEINELIHVWKKKQHLITVRDNKYRTRLNELNNYAHNTGQPARPAVNRNHIVVTTYADADTYGKVEVNYLVPNAGWIPAYDLRANSISEPMTVTYKAKVFQNSGEDWNNVDITLSTFNQNTYSSKPIAGIWRLDYTINKGSLQPQYYSQNFTSDVELSNFKKEMEKNKDGTVDFDDKSFIPLQSFADVNQNMSAIEFDVKLPYTIPSTGQQKLMVILHEETDAKFEHYLLPRKNANAFLLAKLGDWESLNLLAGQANIYFKQTIVGNTYINPPALQDTLELTLGKDDGIVASRKKISEEEDKVAFGKRTLKTYTFEIEVKNLNKKSVEITLEDLIPITDNEEISIKLEDGDGAKFDKKTGRLTWILRLEPGAKTKVNFSYSVEHDKEKPVS